MIDFICNLFTPRKSVGSIIRNQVLDEVNNSVRIESMKTNIMMTMNTEFNNDHIVGYNSAMYSILNLIDTLKSKDEKIN